MQTSNELLKLLEAEAKLWRLKFQVIVDKI